MKEHLQAQYRAKLQTAQDAVKLVRSGDNVYIGTCSSTADALCEALAGRKNELEHITLTCSMPLRNLEILAGDNPEQFRINTYFMGPRERAGLARGITDFTSVHLSQVDIWCRETVPADVVFFEVSPPDENGYMSYGASGVVVNCYLKEGARNVILQVNRNAPYVYGEQNLIHISEADVIVEADAELPENPNLPVDETIQTISGFIVDQVPDGACVQLGLGGVANAVGFGLAKKNDLGGHTELMTDAMMELMKTGVLNNSRKTYMEGVTVAGFTFGSRELYRFVDHNPNMYYVPFPVVNNPVNIAKNDNMISINTAMSIDLLGQVCADNLGGRQYSATGGQLDFVRGAQMSKGGKSFIAITSSVESKTQGRSSRIVSRLPAGSVVTTPRSDVQYVVTEYGCVNLKPLSMKDRVRAMIGLSHPDFRDQLTEDARKFGLL